MILLIIAIPYSLLYVLYIQHAISGWDKYKKKHSTEDVKTKGVSILVPFRNEAKRIKPHLESILPLLKSKNDEIIYINDHSTDDGKALITTHIGSLKNVSILNLEENQFGKKEAIEFGIAHAKNDWIITTDADCTYGDKWLSEWKQSISMSNSKMLVGPVKIKEAITILSKYQSLEFAGLMSLGAGKLAKGQAHTCSGANLAYKKDIFYEVNGFEGNKQFASGDDEFLMHKIHELDSDNVAFLYNSHVLAYAPPAISWKEFFQQRIRWAGKGKGYKIKQLRYEQLFIALYFMLFWISFVLAFNQNTQSQTACAILFFTKIVMDYFLLSKTAYFFKVNTILTYLPIAQLIQFTYVPFIAITSLFTSGKWKGRGI